MPIKPRSDSNKLSQVKESHKKEQIEDKQIDTMSFAVEADSDYNVSVKVVVLDKKDETEEAKMKEPKARQE